MGGGMLDARCRIPASPQSVVTTRTTRTRTARLRNRSANRSGGSSSLLRLVLCTQPQSDSGGPSDSDGADKDRAAFDDEVGGLDVAKKAGGGVEEDGAGAVGGGGQLARDLGGADAHGVLSAGNDGRRGP